MKPATTVSKVCRILTEFRNKPALGVTELARRADLLPSDVHRILTSLAGYGFIEQNPSNKTYRLGMGLMKLGLTVFQRNELREAARSWLQRLSLDMEATAHMAIYDSRESDVFLAEQVDASGEVPFKPAYGATASLHSTALGKAIAAHLDRRLAIELVQKAGLPRLTPRTITQLSRFEAELDRTFQQGYSLDLEESAAGACCLGAPVLDEHGAVVAAISVSMPADRFYRLPENQIALKLKRTATALAGEAGYRAVAVLNSTH